MFFGIRRSLYFLSPYREGTGAILQDRGWQEIKLLQVTKQADTVMLLYLLGDDFSQKIKRVNWDYYEPKTLHDSTLSPSVHAIVAAEMDEVEKGYKYFERSIRIDLSQNPQSSREGLHAASLGGTGRPQ